MSPYVDSGVVSRSNHVLLLYLATRKRTSTATRDRKGARMMMEHGGLLVLIVLSSLAPCFLVTAATDDLPLSAKLLRMTHDDQQSTRCASLNVCRLLLKTFISP